jgi:hypothetical protein
MPETRTYKDRREVLLAAVREKRRRVKKVAIQYKGGKCLICGYKKYFGALDLHHVRGEKKFGIGDTGYTKSWKVIKAEVDKCVLLCANCHREVEGGVVTVPVVRKSGENLWRIR